MARPLQDVSRAGDMAPGSAAAWLGGGGEMGKVLLAKDWSATPLGPIEGWPQSLRTTVSLCLASNFPISIAWGPGHTQIYNDGYWPMCGAKHPHAMGQDFSECWASAWPAIGEAFEKALGGETSFLEDQRMFLDRNGYLEETFFTFSFSPIRDESGGVGGLFHPVTETTSKMLGERRTRALKDVAARATRAKSSREVFAAVVQTLGAYHLDLPFVLLYAVEPGGQVARLVGSTGLDEGPLRPAEVPLRDGTTALWWLDEVVRSRVAVQIDDTEILFGDVACGPYPEPPYSALALPISPPGAARPTAVLVAGVSARLPLNEVYRGFYELLAGVITTAVANAEAYDEQKRRAEGLAELDRAKTTFFSNVSHELRTPLTLVLGPVEEALGKEDEGLRGEPLRAVYRNTLRLLKLVNTLLDFSRIEADRAQVCYVASDLAELTANLSSAFRSAIERAGLRFEVDCPPLPERVHVDPQMWEKIVFNLLSNAYKFTFEGRIAVALRWRGDHVELAVSDSGGGIGAADLPHVFERFHRVHGAAARSHEGSGIGLSLVHELVRLHGGSVGVTSEVGVGTTFRIRLPAGSAHLPAESIRARPDVVGTSLGAAPYLEEARRWLSEAPAETPAAVEAAEASGPDAAAPAAATRPEILVVDDNADLRDYVSGLLRPRYGVRSANDGVAALAAIAAKKPDLVLTDVMMPRLDGFGLLRAVRADPATRELPIVLLSARAGEEATVEGLEAGADDYLVKPFSARELLARVRTHLALARMRTEAARHAAVEEELHESLRARDELLSVVSHELRTPLSVLSLQVDGVMRRLALDPAGKTVELTAAAAERLRRQVDRLTQLVTSMLDVARLATGTAPVELEAIDLAATVRDLVERTKADLGKGHAPIELNAPAPVVGRWNRMRIEQIAVNLLSNAIKFGEGKTIEIDVRSDGIRGTLKVKDHGMGISEAAQARIFDRFARAVSERNYGGLGLGLWTARKYADSMNGSLTVESRPGSGSTFLLEVPLEP